MRRNSRKENLIALSDYTLQQRRIESGAIALFGLLGAWSLYRLAVADHSNMWIIAAAAVAGWLTADLFSGLVHWAFDTWGSVRTPVLGQRFIRPFREHHWDPAAMTRHDFVETNGASCMACAPVIIATGAMPMISMESVFAQAFLLFTALGVLFTNQCHKWAHLGANELHPLVSRAQRLRLVLHPGHHRRHHTTPFNSHYCTTTGWLNAPLQAIGLFRGLERVGSALAGLKTGARNVDAEITEEKREGTE